MKKEFPEKLKAVRISEGLTQETFAVKINIPLPTVKAWEKGKTMPTPRNWLKVKNKFEGSKMFAELERVYISEKTGSRV